MLAHCCRMGRDRAQEPATRRREAVASPQTHRTARQPVPRSTNGANLAGPRSDSAPDAPAVPFAGLCARKTRVSGRLQKRSNKIIPFGGKVLKNFCTGSLLQLALGGNANGSEAAAPRRAARREEAEEKRLQLKAEAGGEMRSQCTRASEHVHQRAAGSQPAV